MANKIIKKLLLINPWQTYKKSLESEYQSYIPYGLVCIASIGLQQGYETKIIDCLEDDTKIDMGDYVRFGKTHDEVKQLIQEFSPDIVGISSTFSMFERDATEIATLVKSISERTIVILGGVTATIKEIFEPLLLNLGVYDIMSRGEGEETFAKLLQNYNSATGQIDNLSLIQGISYKKDGVVVHTEDRPYISDLDTLPFPALDLLNLNKIFTNKYFSRWRNNPVEKRSIPIFTSRGCPYRCCFCSIHSQVGYQFRTFSVDYVIKLMKICIDQYQITHFHFEDDNLTFDIERAKTLFRKMIPLNITWDTPNGVRADRLDEEMVVLMVKSGLVSLSIAVETGNEGIRTRVVHKSLSNESIIKAISICDKYDVPCIVFFVLGFPGETKENIRETIVFAKEISALYHTINMIFIANPLPGTELSKNALRDGYIKKQLSNSDYFVAIRANQASIIETEEFDKRVIFNILKEELDNDEFSVHNISQPMFWADVEISNVRAKRAFPKISNRKVIWEWEEY